MNDEFSVALSLCPNRSELPGGLADGISAHELWNSLRSLSGAERPTTEEGWRTAVENAIRRLAGVRLDASRVNEMIAGIVVTEIATPGDET